MPVLRAAENSIYDARATLLAPRRGQSENVVVILITDETLEQLPYRSPVDRFLLSEVLLTLQKKGVRAIGIDVLLDRPTEPFKDELTLS